VRCEFAPTVRVAELFVIERGAPRLVRSRPGLGRGADAHQHDDAYGFPPFKYLAPSITIGGQGYQELRAKEREILESFLGHVRSRVLASDCFGWADQIPDLVGAEHAPAASAVPADLAAARSARPLAGAWPRWSAEAGAKRSAA